MSYKYHTPAEYHQLILETEAEMDRRMEQQLEAQRLAVLQAYVDSHPEEVTNDPLVRALRSLPSPGATSAPAAQRNAQTPYAASRLPEVIPANRRFHPDDLKQPVGVDSVKDANVYSPRTRIR